MSLPKRCLACHDHLRVSSTDRETGLAQFVCKWCHRIVFYIPDDEEEWTTLVYRAEANQHTETVP